MTQMTHKGLRYLLAVVMLLLLAPLGYSESMPMGDSKELTYVIPKGWHHRRDDRQVVISTLGVSVKFTVAPLSKEEEPGFRTQESIDEIIRKMTLNYVTGSVEKEVKLVALKGKLGSYACFTDASLVGKPDSPGKYKKMTTGMVRCGSSIVLFSLLSNSFDSKLYKKALSIITSLDLRDVAPGPTTIVAPGETWKVQFQAPPFAVVQSGPTRGGHMYRGSAKVGFHMSIFVEEKVGKGHGHKACADYYWPLAKRNPMIDQATVETKQEKGFVKVSYRIRTKLDGIKVDSPHVHLYSEYKGKWIDVHISKFPFKDSDQKLLDDFIKSLKFVPSSKQEAKGGAAKPARKARPGTPRR